MVEPIIESEEVGLPTEIEGVNGYDPWIQAPEFASKLQKKINYDTFVRLGSNHEQFFQTL